MTATLRAYSKGFTTDVGSLLTLNHNVVSGDKLLLVVAGLRLDESTNWDFQEVSYNGVNGSLIAQSSHTLINRSIWLKVYVVNNPAQGNKQVRIEPSVNLTRIAAYALSYTGSTGFGSTATGTDNSPEQEIPLDVSGPFSLALVIGACRIGNSAPTWTFDDPAYVTDTLGTGTSSGNTNLGLAIAHAPISSAGSISLGLDASNVPEIGSLAVEILSESGLTASATISAQAASILTGASATIMATTPTVLVGSIPPTQVLWQGNLFFSTRTRTVNVLVLLTKGDNWVQPDGGSDAQTLTATLKRRRGYLIPQ